MDSGGGTGYYSVLGVPRSASPSQIRSAYRKLAMKWHPDRVREPAAAEAKSRFQLIQEAYSVLADDGRRAMYDLGLYDPVEEEEEGFSDFVGEMLSMMDQVKRQQQGGFTFQELQRMFDDLVRGEEPDCRCGAVGRKDEAPVENVAGLDGGAAKASFH